MYLEKMLKKTRIYFWVTLSVGVLLLMLGLALQTGYIKNTINAKGIVGFSFLPLGTAGILFFKLRTLTKSPQKARSMVIDNTDERLVGLKNGMEAFSFRLLKALIIIFYFTYNFLQPQDIFEAVGWWMLLTLLIVSFIIQPILYLAYTKKSTKNEVNYDD